jgi:hypothetical protein
MNFTRMFKGLMAIAASSMLAAWIFLAISANINQRELVNYSPIEKEVMAIAVSNRHDVLVTTVNTAVVRPSICLFGIGLVGYVLACVYSGRKRRPSFSVDDFPGHHHRTLFKSLEIQTLEDLSSFKFS